MIRSLTGKVVTVTVKNGQFFINPLKKVYKQYKESIPRATYNTWVTQNENNCYVPGKVKDEPRISIVVPAYNTEPSHFLAMVYSVVNQHYDNWELIIVNASDNQERKREIAKSQSIDTRIKVVDPGKNLGIANNTNFGIKQCDGEYIAFLDHDDLLHVCALHSVAYTIQETGAGIIYSDEDKIKDDSSLFFDPFFKPRWSPDLFENVNYINHFTAIKASYVEEVKGLRSKFDGAQDYDLLLRVIDTCQPKIEHIARVLYHWRAAQTSTANDFSTKSYVLEAGTQALREHLNRQSVKGTVKAIDNMPGFYETLPVTPEKISLVIGPVDVSSHRLCVVWLEELSKKIHEDIKAELVIGDWLKAYKLKAKFNSIKYVESTPKSYWREAVKVVSEPVVVCFSVAALPDNKTAISKLAAMASSEKTVVSPFIVSQGGMILDAGMVESEHGKQRLFTGCQLGDDSYYGFTGLVRNVAGLTLDIFAVSKSNFVALVENVTKSVLTDGDLEIFSNKSRQARLVVNPNAPFVYKGTLVNNNFRSEQYFNPQLTQAHTDPYVKVASWGELKELSERDNVE